MAKFAPPQILERAKCRDKSGLIRKSAIKELARQIAERFRPEKIVLFGSYATGRADPGSDVDILVVMPAYDVINQAIRISTAIDHPFPMDLIVRTPKNLAWRLEEGDWFLREIMEQGLVLYEKADPPVASQSRRRSRPRQERKKA